MRRVTAALFRRLGFEQVTTPLFDDDATGKAVQSLVMDDLMTLGPEDSLVLFYAGHGGTRKHRLGDHVIKTGYLIPVDASDAQDKVSSWVNLEGWLAAVSLLPAKHILVILDACHSGIALDPIIKWRDVGSWKGLPMSTLQARRSRRIITSALDDQVARDSGPVYGHSLFTGCLIEGLTHGLQRVDRQFTTGSELGVYLQRRVTTFPDSRQTPDYGTFAFDDRGELVIPLVIQPQMKSAEQSAASAALTLLAGRDDTRQPASDAAAPGAEAEAATICIVPIESAPLELLRAARPAPSPPMTRTPTPRLLPLPPRPHPSATVAPYRPPSPDDNRRPRMNIAGQTEPERRWRWFIAAAISALVLAGASLAVYRLPSEARDVPKFDEPDPVHLVSAAGVPLRLFERDNDELIVRTLVPQVLHANVAVFAFIEIKTKLGGQFSARQVVVTIEDPHHKANAQTAAAHRAKPGNYSLRHTFIEPGVHVMRVFPSETEMVATFDLDVSP